MSSPSAVPPAEFVGGFGFINWAVLLALFVILFPVIRRVAAIYAQSKKDQANQAIQRQPETQVEPHTSQQAAVPDKE